jgi:hypothetical protein
MGFLEKLQRNRPRISGGNGESMEQAVIIEAPNHISGVSAEYKYISRHYGRRGVHWHLKSQSLTDEMADGRRYDILTIRLKSGETMDVHFDITQFFGRF